MKKQLYFLEIVILGILVSCASQPRMGQEKEKILFQTDQAFSDLAQKSGESEAFFQYADPQAVLIQSKETFVGAENIKKALAKTPKRSEPLKWKPVKAEIARSGDLGYTIGVWELKIKNQMGQDSTIYGNYVSVWKKQKDGTWKYVADAGNQTAKPFRGE